MEQTAFRTCPKCGSAEYAFRSRKKIEALPEKNEPEIIETKNQCKACNHEWRVQVAKGG